MEPLVFRIVHGLESRARVMFYRSMGMRVGERCRLESIRVRRASQIQVGAHNAFTSGCWLWPEDSPFDGLRIRVGNSNYFNRDVMIDACGSIVIGDRNMFGPGVYITDSNHTVAAAGQWVNEAPMQAGQVVIGDGCWIGARAIILKDVLLGDRCVVGAGAVVTKSFPAGSVIAGVPAKMLRKIDA